MARNGPIPREKLGYPGVGLFAWLILVSRLDNVDSFDDENSSAASSHAAAERSLASPGRHTMPPRVSSVAS
jgi:hypothetical protein